jgi:hypothetical protein
MGDIKYEQANERLKYWFDESTYMDLFRLKESIEKLFRVGNI